MIEQVHELILSDRRLKVREIAETTGICKMGAVIVKIGTKTQLNGNFNGKFGIFQAQFKRIYALIHNSQ